MNVVKLMYDLSFKLGEGEHQVQMVEYYALRDHLYDMKAIFELQGKKSYITKKDDTYIITVYVK